MRKLPPRIVGLALLAASGCTTMIHRAVYETAKHGPAQVAEFAVGLLTFCLASLGVLLMLHGAKLFEPITRISRSPDHRPPLRVTNPCFSDLPDNEALDTKRGVALLLARRAIAMATADLQSKDTANVDLSADGV